jgi:EAL domain-containing protein (putative c-di-GMP-specific phosphodiesterase class I)
VTDERARPALRLVVAIGAALLCAGAAILLIVRHEVTEQAEGEAVDRARVAASALFQKQLRAHDVLGQPSRERRTQLARLFSTAELGRDAVGATLYAASGKAVFSNGPSPPSVREPVRQALAGRSVSLVTPDRVLRTFVPLSLKNEQGRGVIEVDQRYGPIAARALRSSLLIAAVSELLLVALCSLLVPALCRTTPRLLRDHDEADSTDERPASTPDGVPPITSELQDAVREGQLVVYYQPQADVATHVIRGVEALVRWQHPVRGLVGPSAFIDEAERTGLIPEIRRVVLETSTRQWEEWSDHGVCLDLAVNVSTADLLNPSLGSEIGDLLERHRMPAEYLVLEITESSLFEDLPHARQALGELYAIGVRLAIDDYGTGYSSLAALRQLPIQQVKIDRSFVAGIPTDEANDEIVASTVRLAHRLGATVVGEGVETEQELGQLAVHGCDIAQGYFIGLPLPADELTARVLAEENIPSPDGRHLPPLEVNGGSSNMAGIRI